MLPCHAQTLQILSEGRLCVGYPSGFSIYSILGDHHPICKYGTRQIYPLYSCSILFYIVISTSIELSCTYCSLGPR